jgi:hypothetical protein
VALLQKSVFLPPQSLLLEVAASLSLFGGAAALFERIVAGCAEQGFVPQAALAPTPLAAQWAGICRRRSSPVSTSLSCRIASAGCR